MQSGRQRERAGQYSGDENKYEYVIVLVCSNMTLLTGSV